MNFQNLLNRLADGDFPDIENVRQRIDPRVVFTRPIDRDIWSWEDYLNANRN